MKCVAREQSEYIAASRTTEELLSRIREVMYTFTGDCIFVMAAETGVSANLLYQFRSGRAPIPKIDTLNKMLKFLAPGFNVGIVPICADDVHQSAGAAASVEKQVA